MEQQAEFKPQYQPALLNAGSSKSKDRYGRKFYTSAIFRGRMIVRVGRKEHKTATEALNEAKAMLARYRRLSMAAVMYFAESQEAAQ